MLKKTTLFLLCCTAVTLAAIPFLSSENSKPTTEVSASPSSASPSKDDLAKLSKTFGNFLGRTLVNPAIGIPFDIDAIVEGIKDGAAGKPAPLNEQEYETLMLSIQQNYLKDLAGKNLKDAEKFLQDTSKEKDVISLKDGKILYKILAEGKEPTVKPHADVLINYTGTLLDGTVFSSSQDSGPISISLDQTIPGFADGLLGMKTGEKRRLFIHPEFAYGTQGDLPPNSLLIFDVEMVNAGEAGKAKTNDKKTDADKEEEFYEISMGDYHGSAEYNPNEEVNKASNQNSLEGDYDIWDENELYQNQYRARSNPPPHPKSNANPNGESQAHVPFQGSTPTTPPKGGYPH